MINKTMILAATQNGLTVFKHYIPFEFKVGKNFKNPFYNDTKPSCNVYYNKHQQCFKIKDFGNDDYSGDCFAFVAQLHNLNVRTEFVEVLQIINQDLQLHLEDTKMNYRKLSKEKPKELTSPPICTKELEKPFHFQEKPFTQKELRYWKRYGISEKILSHFQVKAIENFQSVNKEEKIYQLQSSNEEPIFGYVGNGFIKLYRPLSKLRFLYGGSVPENYCFGLQQLPNHGDVLFITGGEKDVMSLYAKGFHAICFNSETSTIPDTTIAMLSRRFKHIILLFDVDKTGLTASENQMSKLSKYAVKRLVLPLSGTKKEKDVADYFALGYSPKDLSTLLLNLFKTLYTQTMVLLKSCEVDLQRPPQFTENIVTVNDVPLGTQGNLLCITGGEGTGKSNYASAIASGTLINEFAITDTLGLKVQINRSGKALLLYDTEQSENQLYKNTTVLLKRAYQKEKPDWFKAFYLTAMSRKERLQAIRDSMDYYYHSLGGIHLVIIDGIADLIRSANDEIESIAIVEELYRLAGIYKTCVLCVLHFVPNSFKLRGHLGSELQRKAAAILAIEKDTNSPEISVVKALKVRDGSPLDVPLMQFSWDKEKAMHTYKGEKPHNEKEKRKEQELIKIAKEIFSKNSYLSYQELATEIESLMDIKERTAKSYIRYMREHLIITKSTTNTQHYILTEKHRR